MHKKNTSHHGCCKGSHHFKDRDAMGHVIERRLEGISSLSESHGTEIPGHLSAAADACRETCVVLVLAWLALQHMDTSLGHMMVILAALSLGWVIWKGGRSAWLGWSRLERLHRLIDQERWEIEHHRGQEREELEALYRAKGFEGRLLEEVVDVLMADGDRLLKVMLEEEMGLTLETFEHPLRQALGAFVGAFAAALSLLCGLYVLPSLGIVIAGGVCMALGTAVGATRERNRVLNAILWNLSLAGMVVGIVYFAALLIEGV